MTEDEHPVAEGRLCRSGALDQAGVLGPEIECILNCSVSRDFLEPATASVVHEKLKISPKATLFDISNACLGILNGMAVLANMIELGQITRGLLVAGENGKPLVETTIRQLLADPTMTRKKFKDAFASLTIASGAAAIVMTHASVSKNGHRLAGGIGMIMSAGDSVTELFHREERPPSFLERQPRHVPAEHQLQSHPR